MLDVRTRDVSNVSADNLSVGRVKQNFLEQSYLGAILTSGDPASAFSSSTVGADVRLATSDFLGSNRNMVFNAYGLTSNNEGVAERTRPMASERSIPTTGSPLRFSGGRFRKTSIRRSVSCSAAICGCFGLPAATTCARSRQRVVSRCFMTSSTRASPDSTRLGRELERLRHSGRLAPELRGLPAQPVRPEPDLRAPVRVVRDFPPESCFPRASTASRPCGSSSPRRRNGECRAASVCRSAITGRAPRKRSRRASVTSSSQLSISLNTNQTFASLPQGDFIAPNLQFTGELCGFTLPFVLQSDPVRQPIRKSRPPEPRALDHRAGKRPFLRIRSGWVQELERGYDFRRQDSRLATKLQYTFRF